MSFSLDALAAIATIAGTLISIFVLIQSRAWLVLVCIGLASLTLCSIFYARHQRRSREAASTVVEGYSIDALNVSNLRRRVDQSFEIQVARHTASIEGEDLTVTWEYMGYCRVDEAAVFEFSIDSAAETSFGELNCYAYDLGHDPERVNVIRPLLVGSPGISKKISVPFLKPLTKKEPFKIALRCTLPRCMTFGTAYYLSTLSFAQAKVHKCTVRIEFVTVPPQWVRVYDCPRNHRPTLVKSLAVTEETAGIWTSNDVMENIAGQSARVYMFGRASV